MDNLAKFVYDPGSLPHFAMPSAGSSSILDAGNVNGNISWTRASQGFASALLGGQLGRTANESWTLAPVTDPRKLELMRCAYQQAVAGCANAELADNCPNCTELQNRFYAGRRAVMNETASINDDGTVNIECVTSCWFGYGCETCIPKDCCAPVGHYCGVNVWVMPGNRNELAKLTLVMLDYAVNNYPTARTKEVTWYLDKDNKPATPGTAARTIKATVPFSENTFLSQANLEATPGSDGPVFQNPALQLLPPEPATTPGAGILEFEQFRRALVPFSP